MIDASTRLVCTRCQGTGYRDTPRAHLGVPGLCFDCDGDGERETQLKTQANRKEAARLERLRAQKCGPIEQKIWDTRNAHRLTRSVLWERWPVVAELKQFTTQQYADRLGLSKTDAWIELCCNTKVYVVWSPEFDPLGWTIAT